ncbi:hypothetical protein ASZ90_008844 [hydrocarbon metagenome]|uniref:PRC-barrel domain-containing protein n=1 Tax=hydrocarbon metagenome TaxID=938273 RepID=A0A0W8FKZ2_9ZZZZ
MFVGNVDDIVLDVDGKKIDALAVGNLNPEIGELKGYKGMQIPFRIIKSVGDIVLIRHIAGVFKGSKKE